MTKTRIKQELRTVKTQLERLASMEKIFDQSHGFILQPYSKRRTRLVKTYWALKKGAVL